MAIYGLNFNGTQIPKHMTSRSGRRGTFPLTVRKEGFVGRFTLAGITDSEYDRDAMLIQADNGRRNLHVERMDTGAGVWFGVYVG
jgi:hypothetical protein